MNLDQLVLNPHFADACSKGSNFLAFPNWYEYLSCTGSGHPMLTGIGDIWLIVAAVIEILLRVAALAAVAIIIYGGIQYATSQGNPETTNKALNAIISAAVGLAITVLAAVIVSFIAGGFN